MKTAVVFYSWSGHTREAAKARAQAEDAALLEVKDLKRPGTLHAYTAGCFRAMRMKAVPTAPLGFTLDGFERIIIMAPVWAGHPAPAILAAFDALKPEQAVDVVLVSASGKSNCREKLEQLAHEKGAKVVAFEDIKG